MAANYKKIGIAEVEIVISPKAKDFYIKMGAVQVDEIESIVKKERKIPRLIYTLKK